MTKKEFLNRCKELYLICAKKEKGQNRDIKYIFNYGKLYTLGVNCLRDKESREFHNVVIYNNLIKKLVPFFMQWNNYFSTIVKDIIKNERKIPEVLQNLLQENINRILNERPDLIGFSIFSEEQLAYSLVLAQILKKKTNLPIIFGGAFMPHIDASAFLEIFEFIDFIITKEGEVGLTEFINHFRDKNFKNVPGLFYRKENKIVHSNKEEFIQNLDSLPFPDFSDFNFNQYFFPVPALSVSFSRGCCWKKCTFCTYYKNYPSSFKSKSIERFIQELKYFAAMGIKHFMIIDDTISACQLDSISNLIIKEKMHIFFGFIARPDKDFSLKLLENIYRAGGRYVSWGVETSNQRILDLMNKGTRIENIKIILNNAHKVGFYSHLFMIKGFPTQTVKELRNDIKFLQKNLRHISSYMHPFNLAKDSFIFNNPEKFGIKNLNQIPLYTKKKKLFYSSSVSFECSNKLNWKKIRKETQVLKKTFSDKFRSFDHMHTLIHASLRG